MIDKSKPLDLGDIFNVTFKLIKETFTRNFIIAAVFLIPAGVVFAFGMNSFFNSLIEATKPSYQSVIQFDSFERGAGIFTGLLIYILTSIVFLIGYLGMLIGITHVSCKALDGERISIPAAFEKVFSVTFLRSIGQILLLILAFAAFILVAVFLIMIAGIGDVAALRFFGVLAVIAEMVFLIFIYIRWYFAFIAIVKEDVNPIHAFIVSNNLVKGYWWRTFGLIILTSIVAQFVVSIITTPISFIVMWDFFSQYFKMFAGGNFNQNDPHAILDLFKSFGVSFGIIIIISSILQSLITPLFNVVMYYDLKIRNNDFSADSGDQLTSTPQTSAFD